MTPRAAQTRWIAARQHEHHLHRWPGTRRPPLLMLHGWMDVGASFQFVVDALPPERDVLALDWRGHGRTRHLHATAEHPWGPDDHYVFADYLADLDALLDALDEQLQWQGQPIDLLGHSMGGNVAMLYAGIRPERVRRLINLEGFGLPATRPTQAPGRYARWLDGLRDARHGRAGLRPYPDLEAVARRLMLNNPRLNADRAAWLAAHWAQPMPDGRWQLLADPAHKLPSAQLYRADEAEAAHRAIQAPVLLVQAEHNEMDRWWKGQYGQAEFMQRMQAVADLRHVVLPDCGHMLHHDQPEALAALISDFLA